MKIPAIRANIGDWVYYVSTMKFSDVAKYVKRVDNELHKSTLLKEMLQRTITENYKSIANYIRTQEERFFNALVLAVYDGEPTWHEVRLEYDNGDEFYDLGILELTGEEKIFPVDGQHRVEGIKEVIASTHEYDDEQIPVIFIGHRTDSAGMQRSRRLFSTLNRYAKPVSMRDIIALDEDDIIAIVSRDLIDTHPLFSNERLLDSKGKSIPESNRTAFTTIITFYECNQQLLWILLNDRDVFNAKGEKARGSAKIREYIRRRPSDSEIQTFRKVCFDFWDAVSTSFDDISSYLRSGADASNYRNQEGGNILFRPVALLPFVKASVRKYLNENEDLSFAELFSTFPAYLLQMNQPIWRWVIWNPDKGTMIMGNKKLIDKIILYYWDCSLLNNKDLSNLKSELKSLRQLNSLDDVDALLQDTQE